MSSPLDTLDIIILKRDENGKPNGIFPSNGETAKHVMASVNLARNLIAAPLGQLKFTQLCTNIVANMPMEAWWEFTTANDLAKNFIDQVVAKFPPTFVDYSFTHPDHAGCTHRKAYEGDFDPLRHAICINGSRVEKMRQAGKIAAGCSDRNSKEQQRYRTFVCKLALTFVHELGHLFVQYLGRGSVDTPRDASRTGKGEVGEAGAHLEVLLFGGCVVPTRNPDEDNEQAGELHLVASDGSVHKIKQKAIDDFVQYEINLPFETSGVVSRKSVKTLGHGIPLTADISDPMAWPAAALLIENHNSNPYNWPEELKTLMESDHSTTQSGPQSIIYQLPVEPFLAL